MQFITLEDEWSLMEVTVFPGTCPLVSHLRMGPYLVAGMVDEQFGVFSVTATAIMEVKAAQAGLARLNCQGDNRT
jgi:hypothetical protein